jgi:hypothetical protein
MILRDVHANIVVMVKQWVIHIVSVSVALGIQHAMHMRHIVICGLSGSTIFFDMISYMARISNKTILNIKCA